MKASTVHVPPAHVPPSPLRHYTGRQGWRQSLPQVPFISISPPLGRASVTASALASDGSDHDCRHSEIPAARVFFFFFPLFVFGMVSTAQKWFKGDQLKALRAAFVTQNGLNQLPPGKPGALRHPSLNREHKAKVSCGRQRESGCVEPFSQRDFKK